MRNPFRSEAEAFRFVLLTVGYFALIVIGASIATWLGVVVFGVLSAAALWFWARSRRAEPPVPTPVADHPESERRILVDEQVLVVCPALNSPLKTWASDEDAAREAAQQRLDATLARLAASGVQARGEVGDGDPLQAIDDALRTFGADEIVISTHPEGRSHWLERGVVNAARERFPVPISHVVVDLEAQRSEARSEP